jgi:hypothetical protein
LPRAGRLKIDRFCPAEHPELSCARARRFAANWAARDGKTSTIFVVFSFRSARKYPAEVAHSQTIAAKNKLLRACSLADVELPSIRSCHREGSPASPANRCFLLAFRKRVSISLVAGYNVRRFEQQG